jgi:CRP-like cAMP-binding protein
MANADTGVLKKVDCTHPVPVEEPTPQGLGANRSDNIILSSMAKGEYELLRGHLEFVELPQHFILFEQGGKVEYVYFPCDGMVSLVVMASDGRSVEVGIVGREGIVGTPRSVGLSQVPYRAISQIPGNAMRLRGDLLEELLPSMPQTRLALGRYTLMQGMQVAQIAACNRLHEIDRRLARWLLMCQDRVQREKLLLTHEFLAQMLGTGRPSVSLAAGALERDGLIENGRGAVKILNRPGLENAACECYAIVQNFNSALGLSAVTPSSEFVAEQTTSLLTE